MPPSIPPRRCLLQGNSGTPPEDTGPGHSRAQKWSEYCRIGILPLYQYGDVVEPAEYRVWVRAPEHVRPVDGVSYDAVPTEYLSPPSPVEEALGPTRRPSGWVLAKAGGRGPARGGVVHAVDCEEAPAGAPVLPLTRALDVAEQPGVRLCSLCGAAAELDPVLRGFEHGFGER
ncbi:DUF6233 domain-containing protein [Streptomyces albidoflavus]|uniref:DUF6233 domain-containing protein n=1 Tax=Streptomyces albidoflavus TaxID=1886 RepID=UPI003D182C86